MIWGVRYFDDHPPVYQRRGAEDQDQVEVELDMLEMFEAHMRPPEIGDFDLLFVAPWRAADAPKGEK